MGIFSSSSSKSNRTITDISTTTAGAEGGSLVAAGDSSITLTDPGIIKFANDAVMQFAAISNKAIAGNENASKAAILQTSELAKFAAKNPTDKLSDSVTKLIIIGVVGVGAAVLVAPVLPSLIKRLSKK